MCMRMYNYKVMNVRNYVCNNYKIMNTKIDMSIHLLKLKLWKYDNWEATTISGDLSGMVGFVGSCMEVRLLMWLM